MSYDIICDKVFLLTSKGTVIPLVQMSSSNVYVTTYANNGRSYSKRETDWCVLKFGKNKPDYSFSEVNSYLDSLSDDGYIGVKINGSFSSVKQYKTFIKNAFEKAVVVEHVNKLNSIIGTYIISYNNKEDINKYNYGFIMTTEKLDEFIAKTTISKEYLEDVKDISLVFTLPEKYHKEKKIKNPIDKVISLKEKWVIVTQSRPDCYVGSLSRSCLRYSYNPLYGKVFDSQSSAEAWAEKYRLVARFPIGDITIRKLSNEEVDKWR